MEPREDPSAAPERALPRTFGSYTLFDFVGRGGMAEIFLARVTTDLGTARLFVVKEILPEFSENARFADMLIHEAKLAAHLTHANIVTVFDLGRENGRLYIAMEYVEGFDLGALLRRCTKNKIPLPLELALTIVTSMLRGLDYAHRRLDDEGRPFGIVHRDVSPSNVLVSFGGDVKVCDFGIAHANDAMGAGSSADRTLDEEAIKGKAGYMSPEQALGQPIDARADVFATGIVLWELLSGHKLYKGEGGRTKLLEQARRAEVPPLTPKGLPEESRLYAIVTKALAKNPEDRFASAQAMLRELEGYAVETGQLASTIRLGDWLVDTFGADVLEQRRIRERAAAAIQRGPLVELRPIPKTPVPPPTAAVVVPAPGRDAQRAEDSQRMDALVQAAMSLTVPTAATSAAASIAGQVISVTPTPPSSVTGVEREVHVERTASRAPLVFAVVALLLLAVSVYVMFYAH